MIVKSHPGIGTGFCINMLLTGGLRVANARTVVLCKRHLNDVYLLTKRKPLAYGMEEAINALRCYSFQEDETVNATLLCNLRTKEKVLSLLVYSSCISV